MAVKGKSAGGRRRERSSAAGGGRPRAVFENYAQRAGNDPNQLEIWCYSDRLSYAPGETLRLHISTTAGRYDLTIRRDGARPEVVHRAEGLVGRFHPAPADCSVKGCGWPVAYELAIPTDWRSGGYLVEALAHGKTGAAVTQDHVFLLRRAAGAAAAPLLLVAATGTWTAYNDWGGSNHYEGITGPDGNLFSPVLSLDRPFSRGFARLPAGAPRIPLREAPAIGAAPGYPHMDWAYANGYSKKYASAGWASYERPFLCWLESQGYRVDLASLTDLHFDPGLLAPYKCVLFVGHDEYWSWDMRDAVDAYVEAGGRVARFAGNFLWQIRLEDGGRTQVCYKYRARMEDPYRDGAQAHLTTNCWESPEVGRPGALTFGLNATRGMYAGWGGMCPRGAGGFTVYRPGHWAFAGSDLYYGDLFGAASRIFGYEVDGLDHVVRNGLPYPTGEDGAPDGLEILAVGLATNVEEDHGNAGTDLFVAGEDARFLAETLYGKATPETLDRVARGNGMIVSFARGKGEVFHAGTCQWVAGLIDRDPFVERITSNVLDRFTA
ncbi:MAG TPA: N,N-dimethylformamidase beta subunit family domain-containing protein [Kiloniellales bacterium]